MDGQTIARVDDFVENGVRWRQMTLANGTVVQTLFAGPWAILEPDEAR